MKEGDEVLIRSQGRLGTILTYSVVAQTARVRPESSDGDPMDPVVVDIEHLEVLHRLKPGQIAIWDVSEEDLASWFDDRATPDGLGRGDYGRRQARALLAWLRREER